MNETISEQQALDEAMIRAAGKRNDLNALRELLQEGANVNARLASVGTSALSWTACGNHIELMTFLLSQGADVNVPATAGFSALSCAAGLGQAQAVALLLAHGANPNPVEPNNFSALLHATFGGSEETVRLLIEAGTHVNIHIGEGRHGAYWFHAPFCGETPLHYAMAFGSQGMIQSLIDAGADTKAVTTHGETAFHWAGRHQRPKHIMQWLRDFA